MQPKATSAHQTKTSRSNTPRNYYAVSKYQISPPSLEQYVQCKKRAIRKRKINGNTINNKINVGVILLWHDTKQQSALTKYQTMINTIPNNNQQHKPQHPWTNQNNNETTISNTALYKSMENQSPNHIQDSIIMKWSAKIVWISWSQWRETQLRAIK